MKHLAYRTMHACIAVAILMQTPGVCRASISTSGDVTPDPSTIDSSEDLFVGNTAFGEMTIDGGSLVTDEAAYIGFSSGTNGIVNVVGSESTWDNASLRVGNEGTGTLSISDGGTVLSQFAEIASKAGSTGSAAVDGSGSTWDNGNGGFVIGRLGPAALAITNGGMVSSGSGLVDALSTVTVDGTNSTWTIGSLSLGVAGSGTVEVTNGGTVVDTGLAYLGFFPSASGTLTVDGPESSIETSSTLAVGNRGRGFISITDGGAMASVHATLGLEFGGKGNAVVSGPGSSWTVSGQLEVGNPGLTVGSLLTISDGGRVMVGNSFKLGIRNSLQITLANTTDIYLDVTGNATLDGTIDVNLEPGYAPQFGDVFQLLTAGGYAGNPTFDFQEAILPSSLEWDTSQFLLNGTIGITGIQPVSGDYDGDGDVDGRDFLEWQRAFGTIVNPFGSGADGNGDGMVDAADYTVWRDHYGTGVGSELATTVPEPSSLAMLLLGSCYLICRESSRSNQRLCSIFTASTTR
jgi:T5SS/PEP-CTERM-associated repeat protein